MVQIFLLSSARSRMYAKDLAVNTEYVSSKICDGLASTSRGVANVTKFFFVFDGKSSSGDERGNVDLFNIALIFFPVRPPLIWNRSGGCLFRQAPDFLLFVV